MRTFDGSKLNIVGQTKLYLKLKLPSGFTSKKLLQALIIDHSYDRGMLISWVDGLAFGIISNIFPFREDTDSEDDSKSDDNYDDKGKDDDSDSDSET